MERKRLQRLYQSTSKLKARSCPRGVFCFFMHAIARNALPSSDFAAIEFPETDSNFSILRSRKHALSPHHAARPAISMPR